MNVLIRLGKGGDHKRRFKDITAVGIGHKVRNLVLVHADQIFDIPAADWTSVSISKTHKERWAMEEKFDGHRVVKERP